MHSDGGRLWRRREAAKVAWAVDVAWATKVAWAVDVAWATKVA